MRCEESHGDVESSSSQTSLMAESDNCSVVEDGWQFTTAAMERFTSAARATTMALASGCSSDKEDGSMSREEAAEFLAHTLTHPLPAPPQAEIEALVKLRPSLSQSEAARALAVSKAVKALKSSRGCTAAEAIDELTNMMTSVCEVTRKRGGGGGGVGVGRDVDLALLESGDDANAPILESVSLLPRAPMGALKRTLAESNLCCPSPPPPSSSPHIYVPTKRRAKSRPNATSSISSPPSVDFIPGNSVLRSHLRSSNFSPSQNLPSSPILRMDKKMKISTPAPAHGQVLKRSAMSPRSASPKKRTRVLDDFQAEDQCE